MKNPTHYLAPDGKRYKRTTVGGTDVDEDGNCLDCGKRLGTLHEDGCDIESCPKCFGQALSCDCNMAQHTVQIRATIAGAGKRKTVLGMGFTQAQAEADAHLQIDQASVRGLKKWIKEREAMVAACEEAEFKAKAGNAPTLAKAAKLRAERLRTSIHPARAMLADTEAKVAAEKAQAKAEMERIANHDCEDDAVEYESDGPLGHGWECGTCGRFLQAG